MAASSTTRRGSGEGYGGPAKGFAEKPPVAFTVDSPTRDAHLENGDPVEQAYRLKQRERNRARKEAAWLALDALVLDPAHPAHFNATRETLNRTEGLPVQKVETTGADGGAIIQRIERVIVDPQNRDS